ncbi:hypothetical protein [Olivibacter sp. XZL3]|uniref:hypothetical protein n=1 Tax=Olivibacter sp. XZL3 TaxID=1735116 RepID=UPI001066D6FA|nr:hypothetical protein [Olivibacter sp. XZL3]
MAKEKDITPSNELGAYLMSKDISDIVIYSKTNIAPSDLSKLKSGRTKRLAAIKLYLISLAVGDSISDTIKAVYPDLDLIPSDEQKRYYSDITKNRTELGKYLANYERVENTKEDISTKTGIEVVRLKYLTENTDDHSLQKKRNPVLQAFELILIEKALEKERGEIFKHLFKDVKINTAELQEKLLEEERRKNALKRKKN